MSAEIPEFRLEILIGRRRLPFAKREKRETAAFKVQNFRAVAPANAAGDATPPVADRASDPASSLSIAARLC